MKQLFTLCLGVLCYLFILSSSYAQVTHGSGTITDLDTGMELPRIVRSNLEMPQSFQFPNHNSRNAIDNKGTEFWLLMERNYDTYVDGIYLDITSDVATSGTVTIPGLSFEQTFTTTAGEITRVTLPSDCQVTTSEIIENKGIHVVSQHEVAVYGLSLKAFTSDCFLALPLDILSSQYLVMSYPNFVWTSIDEGTLGQFAVVSPYDNNTITITPSCETFNGVGAGSPITVVLDEGEVYQVRTAYNSDPSTDLTGSIVQSTLPVALFSGNSCASIPTNFSACDLIIEQVPPVSTWGNNFVTYPLEGRENGDTWRILSSQNNNSIYVNDALVATLNFADFYEFILDEPAKINSSKPVLVMQFSNGDDYDPNLSNNGDPFMMLIPPEEQFMDSYTFATPSSGYTYNYVTVTIPTDGIPTLVLDGAAANPLLFTSIGSSGFSAAGIAIDVGSHTLYNSAGIPFGIYSYGFDQYDSYGYAGGLSLEFIYEGSAPLVTRTSATIQACQQNHAEDEAITIDVTAIDAEDPYTQAVYLYYSSPPGEPYQMVSMTPGTGDTWSTTLSSDMTTEPGVNFYFTATDGQLNSSDPWIDPSNNPYSMAILPNEVPLITHESVLQANYDNDVMISCNVTDATDYVDVVTLNYRTHGANPVYTKVEMMATGKGNYQATIPGSSVNNNGTDYYISARDNFGVDARHPAQTEYVMMNQGVGVDEFTAEAAKIQISPNPFSIKANVAIEMHESGKLTVEIYDLTGKKLRKLLDSEMDAGLHQFTLQRGTLHTGIYLLRVHAAGREGAAKLIIN